MNAYLLSVPHPEMLHPVQRISEFKSRILNNAGLQGTDKAATAALLDSFLKKGASGATLHGEALMMALAHFFWSKDVAGQSQQLLDIDDRHRDILLDVFQVRHFYL